jgi:hypothetical protein
MDSHILNTISIYSIFIPLFIGVINYSNLEANTRTLLLLLVFASIPHIATLVEKELPTIFYNSYILADAILCPLVFLKSSNVTKIKKWLLIMFVSNAGLVLTCLLFWGISERFYSELVIVNSFFQMLLVTIFFYELNYRNEYISLKQERMFWCCMGLLFYAPCTFFVFLFYNKINHYYASSNLNYLWRIHDFFNTLMYLLFAIGFFIKKKLKTNYD